MLETRKTLRNGLEIPALGYGTWMMFEGPQTVEAIKTAIEKGYRLIDTAAMYDNERSVGEAMRESGVPREELFVTTKLEAHIKDAVEAEAAFEESLKKLGLDYVDLYLVHAPAPWGEDGRHYAEANIEVWKVLEQFYTEGRARAIGVSNFTPADLERLIPHISTVPHVNQIRLHPGEPQHSTIDRCARDDILIEAYSPLGQSRLLDHPVLEELSHRYQATPAQLCIRYAMEKGAIPIPKTATPSRMKENADVDFPLDTQDIERLDSLR